MALKARNPKITIGLADPMGAALYSYYTTGELKSSGTSITEGIGQGRITPISRMRRSTSLPDRRRGSPADRVRSPHRGGAVPRGLVGVNVAGAIGSPHLGPGHTIVTILCDYGTRYQSKLFNPGLPAREGPARARMAGAHCAISTAAPSAWPPR
jgi:cysteine synthase